MAEAKIAESLKPLTVSISELKTLRGNPRRGDVSAVAKSLDKFSQRKPIVARRDTKEIVAGNHTFLAAKQLGWDEIAVVWVDDDETTAKAFALADNRVSDLGTYDEDALAEMIADVLEADEELLAAASFTAEDLEALLGDTSSDEKEGSEDEELDSGKRLTLFDRFLVPPFSVFDARSGWWQDRKREWIAMGIEGELGREDKPRTWYIAEPGSETNSFMVDPTAAERRRTKL